MTYPNDFRTRRLEQFNLPPFRRLVVCNVGEPLVSTSDLLRAIFVSFNELCDDLLIPTIKVGEITLFGHGSFVSEPEARLSGGVKAR